MFKIKWAVRFTVFFSVVVYVIFLMSRWTSKANGDIIGGSTDVWVGCGAFYLVMLVIIITSPWEKLRRALL